MGFLSFMTGKSGEGHVRIARSLLLILIFPLVSGCYTTRIETGLPASTTVIKKTFASCWIYGLVPPATVKSAAICPNGVAVVETQQSFANGLVRVLTLGIYTPVQIVVICAEKPTASLMGAEVNLEVSESATTEEVQQVFARAADAAVETGRPVCVYTTE
jgi:hypothetical protein